MNISILLQTTQTTVSELAETAAAPLASASYFDLILKGGWIMLPLFLLSLLSIYLIIERWMVISRLGKNDSVWFSRVLELVHENKIDKALKFSLERPYATAKVVAAGLREVENTTEEIENSIQIEARQQISLLERGMNYLGLTASVAPMLGFLGTIFGIIQIFYNISATGDLNIAAISDGLYQKMICSGTGLLVGIIAYSGFNVLNGRIDKLVLNIDKSSNEILKAVKTSKKEAAGL
ncbi:MotA/TolQ/ExbB proton channel family protein [Viscerimonas tarda]